MSDYTLHVGDALEMLRMMADASIDCCVTSPPYYGLRDYGMQEQIGLESTPAGYVARVVDVFREVRRVLKADGTLWLNLGDSYAGKAMDGGVKQKDLLGIPWQVAFALRADGWYLRQDIIWHKPSPMPESVRDRCTKAHEYIFLLSKSDCYWYDFDAIKEIAVSAGEVRKMSPKSLSLGQAKGRGIAPSGNARKESMVVAEFRNRRSVWTVNTGRSTDDHFAPYPEELIEPCVLAGCRAGGVVLDPFAGTATTGIVAMRLGRSFVGIELNPKYADICRRRLSQQTRPLMFEVEV